LFIAACSAYALDAQFSGKAHAVICTCTAGAVRGASFTAAAIFRSPAGDAEAITTTQSIGALRGLLATGALSVTAGQTTFAFIGVQAAFAFAFYASLTKAAFIIVLTYRVAGTVDACHMGGSRQGRGGAVKGGKASTADIVAAKLVITTVCIRGAVATLTIVTGFSPQRTATVLITGAGCA